MTTPALAALVGEVLDGHYRLDRLLGAGGMGAVYKAHHTELQRDVAIKILHPDIGGDQSISKRFDREAQSASRLDHPNCVRVTDFGTTPTGVKYLVMELLEGEELGARIGKPWAPEAACVVLDQIFAGLEHAHHHGIVHRDLKPENVFLTREGGTRAGGIEVAKLVDFGIAKLLDADGAAEVLTRAGMVFGTPRYMSPEQAAGGKVDERSDLYSVGILAYVMLAGKLPFDSDDLGAVLRMQIMAPTPPLPASVPAPLAAWVESLLEKSRHDRPATATAAREKLAQVRAQMGTQVAGSGATGEMPAQPGPAGPGLDLLGATGFHTAMSIEPVQPAVQVEKLDGPLPGKPEAMVGHLVASRFRLLALLGAGGMGAVFRAEDTQTGTTVAVKILHAALADDDEIASRFAREAKTASELEHPNIVPVFFHGTTPGTGGNARYLVMPLLEGVELRDLIGAPMDPTRAVTLTLQLLDALAAAHALAVVHRDLKPENVFVIRDPQGHEQVQLVDFGLAKVAEAGPSYRALTQFGQVFGTPAYMSPEQCRGEVVDARTDIYATGIILYELLAGHAPFDSDNPLVLLGMQLHQEPPPLPEHVPLALRQLIAGMLIKDREQRVASAEIVIAALRSALAAGLSTGHSTGMHPSAHTLAPSASMSSTIPPMTIAPVGHGPRAMLTQLPRKWLYVGGGVLGLLIVIALLPNGEGDSEDEPSDSAAESSNTDVNPPTTQPNVAAVLLTNPLVGPDASVYREIDRLLMAKDTEAALARVRAGRDQFPNDGGLMWREARALTLAGGETNRVTALHRFANAAAAEPSLGEQTEFVAELRNLLRDPKLRETAIDVSVRELGPLGHSFLLEVINDESSELGYVDRHRVLDELQHDPAMLARVDLRRQLMLDLRQASEAPTPCTTFADALDRIAADGDAVYLEVLMDRSLTIPETPSSQEDTNACVGLPEKLEQVKEQLAAKHPEAAASAKKSGGSGGGSGKKKKGGGFRLPF
jgi:serine/threonine protein kinase